MVAKHGCVVSMIASGALAAACTQVDRESGAKFFGSNRPLVTTAAVRGVFRSEVDYKKDGKRLQPEVITCAEPSPDIASAIGESFGASLDLAAQPGATPPTGASPAEIALAAALSSSRAQAVAQLGERLAVIQLLRDGLYRACEAYANGAITPTTYTLITSRVDELVITLLTTEIAGGAFGRGLVGASAGGSGDASAAQAIGMAEEVKDKVQATVDASSKASEEKTTLDQLQAKRQVSSDPAEQQQLSAAIADQESKVQAAESERKQAEAELQQAMGELAAVQSVSARSQASGQASVARSGISRAPSAEVAAEISTIQRQYFDDPNIDAVVSACISELSQIDQQNNEVTVTIFEADDAESSLVPRPLVRPSTLKATGLGPLAALCVQNFSGFRGFIANALKAQGERALKEIDVRLAEIQSRSTANMSELIVIREAERLCNAKPVDELAKCVAGVRAIYLPEE